MTEIKNQQELEITAKDKAKAVLGLVDNWMNYQTYFKEIPSVSVGISVEDEVIFQKSYGYANLETQEKATPQTMYRIASHSKLFTATAIMRLRADGKLRLDDPVSQLERLARLREQGILTEEEFAAQKKKILGM